ncbi:hypothetical protein FAM09_13465 [Niastella caeni]|uniref:Uncharacterized protein n=1 Tax=Niastella caeni TaxID=2569763 RepID=A0A4S8HV66_9BACT|nr:hypothetical protein [Niastella caeni]THU39507.1 hypothetical protein FAM09_13465 [Niastella caeni]
MMEVILRAAEFSEIWEPEGTLLRESNEVLFCMQVYSSAKGNPVLLVHVAFVFNLFMCKHPFEVATAHCYFEISKDRDILLMELYRIALKAADTLNKHIRAKNTPYLEGEVFPVAPPDYVRHQLMHTLSWLNQPSPIYYYY